MRNKIKTVPLRQPTSVCGEGPDTQVFVGDPSSPGLLYKGLSRVQEDTNPEEPVSNQTTTSSETW